MKTAEIKEMPTSDLVERVEAEVATIARMKTELRQRELNNK